MHEDRGFAVDQVCCHRLLV